MMQHWSRFRSLNAVDRSLVIEASALLVALGIGIASLPFAAVRNSVERYVRLFGRWDAAGPPQQVGRVAWSVAAVAPRLPLRTTCLVESLAVDAMLRRRGYASEIRFGVRPSGPHALAAHAWVEHRGVVVFGVIDELREYLALSTPGSSR